MAFDRAWIIDHPSKCPECGRVIKWAAEVNEAKPPAPGDATICTDCATILVFTDGMGVRRATDAEVEKALASDAGRRAYEGLLRLLEERRSGDSSSGG